MSKRPLCRCCISLQNTSKLTFEKPAQHVCRQWCVVQGGEDPKDALSLQAIFRKRALELVALLRKVTCNLRHPMGLRNPVLKVGGNFPKRPLCSHCILKIDFISELTFEKKIPAESIRVPSMCFGTQSWPNVGECFSNRLLCVIIVYE